MVRRRSRSRRLALLGTALAATAAAGIHAASANEANFQPFLIGDRAVGMGGAFTALASDGSATYYNPAGLVSGSGIGLALSLPLYGFLDREVPRALTLPPAVGSLESQTFLTVPTTFVLSHRFGHGPHGIRPDAVAWSILVPSDTSFSGQTSVTNGGATRVLSVNDQDQTLWIGPSYARRVSSRFGLGLSMFFAYRTLNVGVTSDDVSVDGGGGDRFTHTENSVSSSTVELLFRLGALYHLSDSTNLGLVLMAPSIHLYGTGSVNEILAVSDPAAGVSSFEHPTESGLSSDSHTAAELRAGVAHRFAPWLLTTLDAEVHAPTHYHLLAAPGGPVPYLSVPLRGFFAPDVDLRPVVDLNVGAELDYAQKWPIRIGAFTDFSGAPGLTRASTAGGGAPLAREDRFGATFSLGIHRETFAIDVGVEYAYSSGLAPVAADTQNLALEPFHEHAVFFYVGGIESLEHALTQTMAGWLDEAVQKVENKLSGPSSSSSQ